MVYFCFFCGTLLFIYCFGLKKNRYSAVTYIWAGIYIPLLMYELDWSSLINTSKSPEFNLIFLYLTILTFIFLLLTVNKHPFRLNVNDHVYITNFGRFIVIVYSALFVILYLIENKIGTGYYWPALKKIDNHTFSAPIISYFTNTLYVVVTLNYFAWKATKRKLYILNILLVFILPIFSRSSRMQMVICVIQFGSLLLFYENKYISGKIFSLSKRKKTLLLCIGFFIAIVMMRFTNYRMNHYGKYNLDYADVIRFTGPKSLGFIAPYYGYFPLSFNNLKINLLYRSNVIHNYFGLYSFNCLYFGIFHIHRFTDIAPTDVLRGRYITSTAATVPTGFWEYYYDYGLFCWIPIFVAFCICYWLINKSQKETRSLTYHVLYFWYIPLWFFMSFQNTMFSSTIIVVGTILAILFKHSFRVNV